MAKPYKTVTLRLTTSQYAHLRRQAEASGLKMEPLLRQLIMGVNLRPRPPRHLCRPAAGAKRHRDKYQPDRPQHQRQKGGGPDRY